MAKLNTIEFQPVIIISRQLKNNEIFRAAVEPIFANILPFIFLLSTVTASFEHVSIFLFFAPNTV